MTKTPEPVSYRVRCDSCGASFVSRDPDETLFNYGWKTEDNGEHTCTRCLKARWTLLGVSIEGDGK
jgi:hypothetical protein